MLRGLSVEMRVEPGDDKLSKEGGQNRRTIERAKLNGIALVDRPAYGDSKAILKRFEVLIDEEVLAEAAVEHRFESEYYYDSVETISDDGDVRKREISPGAFDVSIRDPSQEITLSIGRNPNDAIGSKLAGTLTLDMVDDRLVARVDNPPETTSFRDLQARMAAGSRCTWSRCSVNWTANTPTWTSQAIQASRSGATIRSSCTASDYPYAARKVRVRRANRQGRTDG